jgi:D-serine deaminase-like pyridoxal phosphate-dependent protein
MASQAREMSVAIRPHFKAHKSIELARLQIDAGAVGMTAATVAEAEALVQAGIADVLVANQAVQPFQIEALARLASRAQVSVLVDDSSNLCSLAGAASQTGSAMVRCGLRTPDSATALARLAADLDGIRFEGVSTYEGHCTGIENPEERSSQTSVALGTLLEFVEAVRSAGIEVPTVSAGGTSTSAITGVHPCVTEIQPGAYVLMDLCRCRLVSDFDLAISVIGTVISRHGEDGVLDCGLKSISTKEGPPTLEGDQLEVVTLDEEHLRFKAPTNSPQVGDRLQALPTYGPLTINLHDRFHVLRSDRVVAEWPVAARR